jgi:hypothetical protein
MSTKDDFNDDLPDMTDEIMNEFKAMKPVDLHLGPAEVKTFGQDSWVKQYGPKPPGPGIIALDALIVIFSCAMFWLIVNVWIWTFS